MYLNRSPLYFLILDVGKYVKTNFFLSFAELVLLGNRSIYGGGVSFFKVTISVLCVGVFFPLQNCKGN